MTTTNSQMPEEPALACNPGAFTAEERARWQALGKQYLRGAPVRRELPDGYAFEVG